MKYVHVGVNVVSLEKSIDFYEKVFGVKAVKVKTDYAKFLLETPGLNFTLNVVDEVTGNQVNHFGFQVDSLEEVLKHKERLEKEGFLHVKKWIQLVVMQSKINFGLLTQMGMNGNFSIPNRTARIKNKIPPLVV